MSVDVVLALAWFAAFGILVDELNSLPCGSIWDWGVINDYNDCSRWKAAEAFSFLSAIVWLISGLLVRCSGRWFLYSGSANTTALGTVLCLACGRCCVSCPV